MAGGGVAVQVQRAGWFQHAVQFHQAGGHHYQVGHHLVGAHELAQRADHARHVHRRVLHQVLIGALGGLAPVPRIVKGGDLRVGTGAALVPEQHVVRAVGVERRVEIDQVDRLVLDVLAQDVEVVTVVKSVHFKDSPKMETSLFDLI